MFSDRLTNRSCHLRNTGLPNLARAAPSGGNSCSQWSAICRREPCRLAVAGLRPTSGSFGSYRYADNDAVVSADAMLPVLAQLRPRAVANPSRSRLAEEDLKASMSIGVKMYRDGLAPAAAADAPPVSLPDGTAAVTAC